jgi:hypothetical protein
MASIHKQRTSKGETRYRAMWRDSLGRQHGKTFRTKADAQWHLDSVVHDRLSGCEVDRRAGRQTFGELWHEVHVETDYAAATRSLHALVWGKNLRPVEHVRISDIDAGTVGQILSRE